MKIDPSLPGTVAALLETAGSADAPELDALVPHLYDELRAMARRHLDRGGRNATLQTTELVHEAYLRLVGTERLTRRGRAYFFGAASRAMRFVLIEAARRRGAARRGGGEAAVTLEEGHAAVDAYAAELLDLDRALTALEKEHPRQARVVECRYFGGYTVEDTAAALDVSPRTVKSDWALARAWLFAALRGAAPERPG